MKNFNILFIFIFSFLLPFSVFAKNKSNNKKTYGTCSSTIITPKVDQLPEVKRTMEDVKKSNSDYLNDNYIKSSDDEKVDAIRRVLLGGSKGNGTTNLLSLFKKNQKNVSSDKNNIKYKKIDEKEFRKFIEEE